MELQSNTVKALSIIQEILGNIQSGRADHNYPLIAELDTIIRQMKKETQGEDSYG